MDARRPNDAMIAALRRWREMLITDDELTRQSLWRAAAKYALKARRDALLLVMEQSARAAQARLYAGGERPGAAEMEW